MELDFIRLQTNGGYIFLKDSSFDLGLCMLNTKFNRCNFDSVLVGSIELAIIVS
jgi:hypothetical protein